MTTLSDFVAGLLGGTSGKSGGTGFKANIVLLDFNAGTRSITVTAGKYRRFVVGGGGGENASAGLSTGGTSTWADTVSGTKPQATGGSAGAVGGVGSGGSVNTNGSSTLSMTAQQGGGASGHRMGSGPAQMTAAVGGCGWSQPGGASLGGIATVDGFGLGIPPGFLMRQTSVTPFGPTGGYGCGGAYASAGQVLTPGIGGGGAGGTPSPAQDSATGGPGGGGAASSSGNKPGSGGGYSEDVVTLAAGTYSYTVGAAGVPGSSVAYGGAGLVGLEKLS